MSLKRQTLWSFLPLGTLTVLNLISVPLFYRYLGPEMYALWFYVQTLGSSFGFIDFGMGVSVSRHIGVAIGQGDREAAKAYWATGNATAIPFLLVMAIAFVLVGIIYGPRWFNVRPDNIPLLRWSFVAGGVSLFLSYYLVFWNVLSQAHLDFKFISLVRVGANLLQIIPAIILAKLTANPLILIIWVVCIALVELSVFVIHSLRSYKIGLNLRDASLARLKEMAAFTGKSFATLMINSVFGSVDRLLAGRLCPPIEFASYTIASNLGGRLSAFSFAAAAPVFNNTSRASGRSESTAAARIYDETFALLIPWYTLGVVWIGVWAYPIARLWLGEQGGMRVAPFLLPLVLAYSLSAIAIISGAQLGALNRIGTQAIFSFASGLVTILGVFLGWNFGGIYGLAWGFMLSRVVMFIQDLFLIRMIGAQGWLSPRLWLMILFQTGVGFALLPLRHLAAQSSFLCLLLAFFHGGSISCYFLRQQFLKKTAIP